LITANIIAVKAIFNALCVRIHAYADAPKKDNDRSGFSRYGNLLSPYQRLRECPDDTGCKKGIATGPVDYSSGHHSAPDSGNTSSR
jgi:hypothetical protein